MEKHLEFIQNTITRMAQNSFVIKGWSITLIVAILVVTYQLPEFKYALLALLPTFVFWGLDAYYLRQERLFRKLYDFVRLMPNWDTDKNKYSMNTKQFDKDVDSWFRICFSKTIGWLYGSMVIVIIILGFIVKTAANIVLKG
jgi:hypothetical protein